MWVGKVAFIVLLILGGITGVVMYISFHDIAPVSGNMQSFYRKNLTPQDIAAANPPPAASSSSATTSAPVGASVTILAGASTQGNPSYSPDTVTVKKGDA